VAKDAQFDVCDVDGAACLPFWRDARFLAALDPIFPNESGVEKSRQCMERMTVHITMSLTREGESVAVAGKLKGIGRQ
jgi:hypothetical protein